MHYRIIVCNLQTLGNIDGDEVVAAITQSNYHTLCEQYGLNTGLVETGMMALEVAAVRRSLAPFFALYYLPNRQQPIIVNEWDIREPAGEEWLESLLIEAPSREVEKHLRCARFIVAIELSSTQLEDLGGLLAYELARWAVERGHGLIRGLDGVWYRLNDHKAFIPVRGALFKTDHSRIE